MARIWSLEGRRGPWAVCSFNDGVLGFLCTARTREEARKQAKYYRDSGYGYYKYRVVRYSELMRGGRLKG
jgi:hypothetical protein